MGVESIKIFISSTSFEKYALKAKELLKNRGYELIFNSYGRPLKAEELKIFLKDIDGMIAGVDEITSDVIYSSKNLKVISRYGTGVDNIDLDAAAKANIVVTNTPGANAEAVADMTFALMLSCARKIVPADITTKAGGWQRLRGKAMYEKTLGIIGLGTIGKKVAERAKGFKMKILAYDPFVSKISDDTIKIVDLNELFKLSDFISLHVPLTENTRELINKNTIKQMKKGAIIINTARGELINEDDLYDALVKEHLFGAGLDVFIEEPPRQSKLLELENVVLTPHIGGYTEEALEKMGLESARNLIDVLEGNKDIGYVN